MPSLMLIPVAVSEELKQTDRIALYILDMTASPAEAPLVTSELRVLVQPAKRAFPIKLLYEELLNV